MRLLRRYRDVIQDPSGNVIRGATISVTRWDGSPVTLYSDRNGLGVIPSTILSDDFGRVSFYAPSGIYRITTTIPGYDPVVTDDIVLGSGDAGDDFGFSFFSENLDITDELRAFLDGIKPQLQDRYGGGDNNNIGITRIDFHGRQYQLSDQIWLTPDYMGLELANFAFHAAPSSNWASADAVLKIGDASGSGRIVRVGLSDYTINTNRLTNGVRMSKTTACYSDRGEVTNFKDYGIKADTSNRRIEIYGGTLQEYGSNDAVGQVYANRTGIGLWIEKADGIAEGVVMPCCKHGIYLNNIRNFAVDHCHPWMGTLSDEADRFDAYCTLVGAVAPDEEDNGASGIQFTGCYFDHGPVAMTSFGHQFDSCTWTGGETGIYPVVLIALEPDETAVGLKFADARISRQHNRGFFDYRTSGAGSWASRKLHQYTVVSAGTAELLPSKMMSSINFLETGDNGKPDKTLWTDLARVQIADTQAEIPVAGRLGQVAIHSTFPGSGMTVTQWGTSTKPPSIWGALSRSTSAGVFGSPPVTGDVLMRIGGTGDNGTSFIPSSRPGGAISITAAGDWSATSTPTRIKFQTTGVGSTGDFRDVWSVMPNGNLRPETSGAEVGEVDAPVKNVRTKATVLHTTTAPSADAAGLQVYFDGTNLMVMFPNGTTKTVNLT